MLDNNDITITYNFIDLDITVSMFYIKLHFLLIYIFSSYDYENKFDLQFYKVKK